MPKPDDFDETTSPPRTRPRGVPAPAYAAIPPGESAEATFRAWDAAGRIPAGAVLAEFVWTDLGRGSGYVLAAGPAGLPAGAPVIGVYLAARRIAATLVEAGPPRRVFVVLAPAGDEP